MGVDLYVGTLTRYFTRRWLTAQQQFAQSLGGVAVKVVSPRGAFPMAGLSYGEGHRIVQRWRTDMARSLRKHGVELGAWHEDVAQPHSTVQITWEGYGAMMLWAAYAEAPKLMPTAIQPSEWQKDPAFRAAAREDSRFASLYFAQMWLPVKPPEPAVMPMPDDTERAFSSLDGLMSALAAINELTWRVTPQTREAWLAEAGECT